MLPADRPDREVGWPRAVQTGVAILGACAFGAVALSYGYGFGGGGGRTETYPQPAPGSFSAPNTPTVWDVISLDSSTLRLTASAYSADPGDANDSIRVRVARRGAAMASAVFDSTFAGGVRMDTIVNNDSLKADTAYVVDWAYKATSGGWSAFSDTFTIVNTDPYAYVDFATCDFSHTENNFAFTANYQSNSSKVMYWLDTVTTEGEQFPGRTCLERKRFVPDTTRILMGFPNFQWETHMKLVPTMASDSLSGYDEVYMEFWMRLPENYIPSNKTQGNNRKWAHIMVAGKGPGFASDPDDGNLLEANLQGFTGGTTDTLQAIPYSSTATRINYNGSIQSGEFGTTLKSDISTNVLVDSVDLGQWRRFGLYFRESTDSATADGITALMWGDSLMDCKDGLKTSDDDRSGGLKFGQLRIGGSWDATLPGDTVYGGTMPADTIEIDIADIRIWVEGQVMPNIVPAACS